MRIIFYRDAIYNFCLEEKKKRLFFLLGEEKLYVEERHILTRNH